MPYVGEIVHYVSYGTPGGEYKSECRAAIVAAVDTYQDGGDSHIGHVSLCVLNPTGMFFNRAVLHDVGGKGGTWHASRGPATLSTPCPEGRVAVPVDATSAFDLKILAATEDVDPRISRVANSIGYALVQRGVQVTADDAFAAAKRVLEQQEE